ncbi:cation:proton antiporter [Brevundimonas sp.]|uniref:cation:proton antiporter domain-containing protein n=1 Tax=Brevundimonas sp. TaxID=1871086 RepID=UPI0025F6595C|nr:cation:proton antiporter [Brevundimonas sp.]
MTHGPAPTEYKDIVVFLAAAGILVPLFSRLKISPVLAFLAAGVLLGPDGLGRFAGEFEWIGLITITDRGQMALLSELGVVFLMFMIGLELSWERLRSMRRLVFGLGVTQILVCAAVLAAVFSLMGQDLAASVVLGLALALSSTAVVMPVMAERGRLRTPSGRAAFSVLLAQDLAVAPILVMITVLAAGAATGEEGLSPEAIRTGLLSLVPAVVGLAVIVLLGRLALRPMFRSVAKTRNAEMFLAASLFLVLGTGIAAQISGLSMAIGALVAGLLLAETEFRREVEVTIEPFKGLLLGVFFVSVGVGLDLDAIAAHSLTVVGLAFGLIALKAAAIFAIAKAFRLSTAAALETALVLGPGGEFAFVILSEAMGAGVVPRAFSQGVLLAATLSIFLIPILAAIAPRLNRRMKAEPVLPSAPEGVEEPLARVVIVGYGRVGRLVGELLREHGVSFTAVDSDPVLVAAARRNGEGVWYADAARPEILRRLGVEDVQAIVVTMDAPTKVDEVVRAAREVREDLILIARARDERHAARLYRLGVTDAVPETTEASLQLAENTLVDLGVPMGLVLASIHQKREDFRRIFQAAAPDDRNRPTRALRSRAQEGSV